jgi:motility quorum-sensing regulator/GCU-specific mRNA interferase toxin
MRVWRPTSGQEGHRHASTCHHDLALAPLRCHRNQVEKRRPCYPLGRIKADFSAVSALRITKTALTCAAALDISLEDIVAIIQSLTPRHFYKSMTSHVSSAVWQDVYHAPWRETLLYLKFTTDAEGYLVISLKEK